MLHWFNERKTKWTAKFNSKYIKQYKFVPKQHDKHKTVYTSQSELYDKKMKLYVTLQAVKYYYNLLSFEQYVVITDIITVLLLKMSTQFVSSK